MPEPGSRNSSEHCSQIRGCRPTIPAFRSRRSSTEIARSRHLPHRTGCLRAAGRERPALQEPRRALPQRSGSGRSRRSIRGDGRVQRRSPRTVRHRSPTVLRGSAPFRKTRPRSAGEWRRVGARREPIVGAVETPPPTGHARWTSGHEDERPTHPAARIAVAGADSAESGSLSS